MKTEFSFLGKLSL